MTSWPVAYAATDANTLGATPGVTVIQPPEAILGDETVLGVTPGSVPEVDGDQLDESAADTLLASLGYRRIMPWTLSSGRHAPGNWAACVESRLHAEPHG